MKTIYLCGPINGCTDSECKDWRGYVQERWPSTIDPMVRDYRGKENTHVKEIVELDKDDIMRSDILLVNYDKPSVGTSMEMLFAWERGKYVIVVSVAASLSPWLKYHSHRICGNFEEALAFIAELA